MKRPLILLALTVGLVSSCVDPADITLRGTVNVLVVDGSLTNLIEPQLIRLSRSKSDPLTGQPGVQLITNAQMELIVDSAQVMRFDEITDGTYRLPSDFRGQVGHAYQLRFTLSDGARYASNQQVMQPVPPIVSVSARFNPNAISPPFADGYFTAGHDVFATIQDPVGQANYYRWQWQLYEIQAWCRTCYQSIYVTNRVEPLPPNTSLVYYYTSTQQPYEACFSPATGTAPAISLQNQFFDYPCRTQCWEIIYSHDINVFSDQFSNGGLLVHRPVARIPLYQSSPCLVNVRQESLTRDAYQYFNFFQQQTQGTGTLVDTPPTALPGNVRNLTKPDELVVGYFTASAVTVFPYYLDRKDTKGSPSPGLFFALNGRIPVNEKNITFVLNRPKDGTALCAPIDQRTPIKPPGWPN